MKKVYVKRNDLFKGFQMILMNNVTEVDEAFVDDNFELFFNEVDEEDINEEIERLSAIDWTHEEYKPYDINDKMTSEEIIKHLQAFRDDISNDLEPSGCEPYQYFLVDCDEWERERLQSYGVDLGYSNKLEHYILPIYDFGTGWNAFSYSKEVEDDYTLASDETLERSTCY